MAYSLANWAIPYSVLYVRLVAGAGVGQHPPARARPVLGGVRVQPDLRGGGGQWKSALGRLPGPPLLFHGALPGICRLVGLRLLLPGRLLRRRVPVLAAMWPKHPRQFSLPQWGHLSVGLLPFSSKEPLDDGAYSTPAYLA